MKVTDTYTGIEWDVTAEELVDLAVDESTRGAAGENKVLAARVNKIQAILGGLLGETPEDLWMEIVGPCGVRSAK